MIDNGSVDASLIRILRLVLRWIKADTPQQCMDILDEMEDRVDTLELFIEPGPGDTLQRHMDTLAQIEDRVETLELSTKPGPGDAFYERK